MPERVANGLRFHVQELRHDGGAPAEAERPAVVCLHGLILGNLSSYYYTLANALALTADVRLYDMRGHGRSEMPDAGYSVDDNVDDLVALLDGWGLDRPVHLVGNSFGGAVALAFAIRHPERVASLFLIEAHFATEGWGEHMAGSLALAAFGLDEGAVQTWLDEHGDRRVNRLARRAEHLLTRTTMIDDLKAEQPVPRAALEQLACPVYALYGVGSDILDRAEELDRFVPRSRLEVLEEATHSVLTEAPEVVRDRVLRWVGDPEAMVGA